MDPQAIAWFWTFCACGGIGIGAYFIADKPSPPTIGVWTAMILTNLVSLVVQVCTIIALRG